MTLHRLQQGFGVLAFSSIFVLSCFAFFFLIPPSKVIELEKKQKKTRRKLTATAAEPTLPVPSSSCSDSDWEAENRKPTVTHLEKESVKKLYRYQS